jgi:hypothetical protein
MSQLSHHVDIYIAGNVFINGLTSQGKLLYAQCAKVESLRINLFQYLQRKIKRTQERKMRKEKQKQIYQIDQVLRGRLHNQIKTIIMEELLALEATIQCLETKMEASSWD